MWATLAEIQHVYCGLQRNTANATMKSLPSGSSNTKTSFHIKKRRFGTGRTASPITSRGLSKQHLVTRGYVCNCHKNAILAQILRSSITSNISRGLSVHMNFLCIYVFICTLKPWEIFSFVNHMNTHLVLLVVGLEQMFDPMQARPTIQRRVNIDSLPDANVGSNPSSVDEAAEEGRR